VALAAAAVALVAGVREVLADRHLARAAEAGTGPGVERALAEADRATRLRPDSIRTWYAAARVAARGAALTDVDAALGRARSGLRRSPRDPALRLEYADLAVERAARSGLPDDAVAARGVTTRFLRDAPNHPGFLVDHALALLLSGDRAAARVTVERAASLAPSERRLAAARTAVGG